MLKLCALSLLFAAPANATRLITVPKIGNAPTLGAPKLHLSLTLPGSLPTLSAPVLETSLLPLITIPQITPAALPVAAVKTPAKQQLKLLTTKSAQQAVRTPNAKKSNAPMTQLFDGTAKVNAADAEMPSGVAEGMQTQGLLLSVVAQNMDMHITVVSMILNAHRDAGLNLQDWIELGKEIKETDASDAEVAQAMRDELKGTRWETPLPEGRTLEPEEIMDLGMAIRGVPGQIVIARNNTFFRWKYALQADHPLARTIDYSKASAKRVGEDLELTLGEIDGQKIRARMVIKMMDETSLSNHFDELLAASQGLDTTGLLKVARDLQAQGLISPDWNPPS